MSNTSKGPAEKGSKYWMQYVVNDPKLQEKLNSEIKQKLEWILPLKNENYKECTLRNDYISSEILSIKTKEEKSKIFSFWPSRQPQWDGIALSKDKKTLYLVEAKAHKSECISKMKATNGDNINLIEKTMKEVFDKYYQEECSKTWENTYSKTWKNTYYQLANRLTFLHKLNDEEKIRDINIKLVLLNFINDGTYKSTSKDDWENHYEDIFLKMIGTKNAPENVLMIYFPDSHKKNK